MFNYCILILSFFIYPNLQGQNYCIQFSKEKKKNIIIEEGKKISFVIKYNENWEKGVITKITADSLFIEQERPKEDMLTERESNYEIIGYAVTNFRMIAYSKTTTTIGKTSLSVVILATLIATNGMLPLGHGKNEPAKKFFKKNIDFEEGWSAKIVACP
ncbi:MAG: hypothetical protein COA97_10855 [Flavobacteriales bacterium]|nr:MAG: hypothetical protein COA97_10855 [Flavobacteriales bacterium]